MGLWELPVTMCHLCLITFYQHLLLLSDLKASQFFQPSKLPATALHRQSMTESELKEIWEMQHVHSELLQFKVGCKRMGVEQRCCRGIISSVLLIV